MEKQYVTVDRMVGGYYQVVVVELNGERWAISNRVFIDKINAIREAKDWAIAEGVEYRP